MLKLAGPVNCEPCSRAHHTAVPLQLINRNTYQHVRNCLKLGKFLNYTRPSAVGVSHATQEVWCSELWLQNQSVGGRLSVPQFPHTYN